MSSDQYYDPRRERPSRTAYSGVEPPRLCDVVAFNARSCRARPHAGCPLLSTASSTITVHYFYPTSNRRQVARHRPLTDIENRSSIRPAASTSCREPGVVSRRLPGRHLHDVRPARSESACGTTVARRPSPFRPPITKARSTSTLPDLQGSSPSSHHATDGIDLFVVRLGRGSGALREPGLSDAASARQPLRHPLCAPTVKRATGVGGVSISSSSRMLCVNGAAPRERRGRHRRSRNAGREPGMARRHPVLQYTGRLAR